LLAALGNLGGVVLLDLGAAGLLLGLELEALHLVAGLAGLDTGSVEGAVGLVLGCLGTHDALAGLHDGRVQLDRLVSMAEGPMEDRRLAAYTRREDGLV